MLGGSFAFVLYIAAGEWLLRCLERRAAAEQLRQDNVAVAGECFAPFCDPIDELRRKAAL